MVGAMKTSRRAMLVGASAVALSRCAHIARSNGSQAGLAGLEAAAGGRLGVCVIDLASSRSTGHRLSERFTMCSTFKLPLAAAILQRVDQAVLADVGRIAARWVDSLTS